MGEIKVYIYHRPPASDPFVGNEWESMSFSTILVLVLILWPLASQDYISYNEIETK